MKQNTKISHDIHALLKKTFKLKFNWFLNFIHPLFENLNLLQQLQFLSPLKFNIHSTLLRSFLLPAFFFILSYSSSFLYLHFTFLKIFTKIGSFKPTFNSIFNFNNPWFKNRYNLQHLQFPFHLKLNFHSTLLRSFLFPCFLFILFNSKIFTFSNNFNSFVLSTSLAFYTPSILSPSFLFILLYSSSFLYLHFTFWKIFTTINNTLLEKYLFLWNEIYKYHMIFTHY
jgi:hypothetical protein